MGTCQGTSLTRLLINVVWNLEEIQEVKAATIVPIVAASLFPPTQSCIAYPDTV